MTSRAAAAALSTFTSLAFPVVAAAAPPPETRALWVVRTALATPAEADRVVDAAAAGGFNTLLVQVRGRGDAFYRSKVAPRSPLLAGQPADYDPLARVLARARSRGLAVHAWVNVLLVAGFGQPLPPGHVARQHPEWLMVPREAARTVRRTPPHRLLALLDGQRGEPDIEGLYLSPALPGVRRHLAEVVRELVHGYPLDGLHLDFIRYPGPQYDYSPAALAAYRARGGRKDPVLGPGGEEAWTGSLRSSLTGLVAELTRAARHEQPRIVLSAAVVPEEARAVEHKFQDWPRWVERGLLDAVCPMIYAPEREVFVAQLERLRARVPRPALLWPGIGAYRLGFEETAERVAIARGAGAGGVAVFSHESLGPDALAWLRRTVFAAPAGAGPAAAHGEGVR